MITRDVISNKLADLEQEYFDVMVRRFGEWDAWAKASRRMADGEDVDEKEIPEPFIVESRMMRVVLEMEAKGTFDWNNPKLREIFQEAVKEPFYLFWAGMIARVSLRLARLAGVKTLVEIGAGRGNLTETMVGHISKEKMPINLLITDVHPVVLENRGRLKEQYPGVTMDTVLWDIREDPPEELLKKIEHPCLFYDRSSIVYTTIPAIANIGKVADIAVFGDMLNNTGRLYAFDEVFKKIGALPLLYSDLKPLLDSSFRDHVLFDLRAQEAINLPNTTMLIAWK